MKLLLTITSGTLAGRVYELESGFLTIGRSENCSIRFDPRSERIASKQHAFVEARNDGYYLTDNNSLNGTLVNGEKIQTSKINSGDTLQFGRNGVMAAVEIDATRLRPENLREQQILQFDNAAQNQPDNLQNSISGIGLGRLEVIPPPSKTGRFIGIGITIFAIVFMSHVVGLLMFASLGIVPAVLASFVAFTPAVIYLLPFIWLDRYDPEPFWLLALAFAWGALVSVIISFVVNTVIGTGVAIAAGGGVEGAQIGNFVGAIVSAPIFEEASKGVGLLILLIYFRRYFDDILDGIVFAGVIALGFATVENVLYYGTAIAGTSDSEMPSPSLAALFLMRGILSPFAHVTFTAMTGIGCGIARESHNRFVKIMMPILGYCAAVALHAIWNGMAVIGGLGGFLIGYIVLEIPFFLIIVGFSVYVMYRQNKILKDMLAIDIAQGLIPKEHGDTAVSAFKSSGWLLGGLFSGKFRPRSQYLRAIGKLGLSYWHIQRATAAQGHTASFQQNPILREEVLKWRDKV